MTTLRDTAVDIHEMTQGEVSAVVKICMNTLEEEEESSYKYIAETLKMPAGVIFTATDASGAVLGFIRGTYTEWNKIGNIGLIALSAEAKGKGIGTLLMSRFEDWARSRGVRKIFVDTGDDNKSAQIFYIKCGYSPELYMVDYYEDGLAGINFGKRLR